MCELVVVPPKQSTKQRHKLWEIRPDLHCSILGICLSYADLLKIGRKAGFVPGETATEYDVHNYFVHRAEEPDRLARLMHKALDGKYRAANHASQQAQCAADLEEFWSDALARGDISGPYWALMTHPLTTEALLVRAFGEVHMLSHLTVTGIEGDRVQLLHPEGGPRSIRPREDSIRYRLDVYETRPIEIRAGDRIRWTRNDKARTLILPILQAPLRYDTGKPSPLTFRLCVPIVDRHDGGKLHEMSCPTVDNPAAPNECFLLSRLQNSERFESV